MSTVLDVGPTDKDASPLVASGRLAAPRHGWLGRALREPLVHFVVLGVVVFGGYRLMNQQPQPATSKQRIEITPDDLRQLAVVWLAQGREKPTPEQLQSLVNEKADSEMLVREAVALGLDKDDEVIKRRLTQKMDFLLADISSLAPPINEELATWFEAHKADFTKPPRMRFQHLYFSTDKRGQGAQAAAEATLKRIAGQSPASLGTADIADPFMFRDNYSDVTPEQMAKEFGGPFAQALFELKPGDWRGPIQSGYGWHLIWIDSLEAPRVPTLEEVRSTVAQAWQEEKYREVKERAMNEIRSRYEVVAPSLKDVKIDDLAIAPSNPASLGAE